jgi:hypothetical protein
LDTIDLNPIAAARAKSSAESAALTANPGAIWTIFFI